MSPELMHFPGLPTALWRHGTAVCLELTDWEALDPGPDWVALVEDTLGALGLVPTTGFALSGDLVGGRIVGPETRGAWRRIRGRAATLLGTRRGRNVVDVNTGYGYRVGESDRDGYAVVRGGKFFPNSVREVGVAVSTGVTDSPDALMRLAGRMINQKIRPKWGAAFTFPAAAGAGFYLNNMTYTGPEIRALGPASLLDNHRDRVHRADSRAATHFSFGNGYVREIYEINFLSETHLRAPLHGASVREYAGSLGKLTRSEYWPDLYEWRLSGQDLARARRDWEDSGLVLAAEREPFRWQ